MPVRLVLSLGVLLMWPTPGLARSHDPWLGRDKAKHFGASAVLAVAGYAAAAPFTDRVGLRLGAGAGLALSLGVGKEIADRYTGGHPSMRDLTWDLMGTATGLVSAWLIDRWFFRSARTPARPPRAALSTTRGRPFGVISAAHVHVRD